MEEKKSPNQRFVENNKDEILDVAEPALGIVDNTNLKKFIDSFDTTEKEIRQFVVDFIDVAVEDEELRTKLLQHFKSFELKKWSASEEKPSLLGAVGSERDKDGHVKRISRWSYIGQKKPLGFGRVKTDLSVVRCIIHELFHSISSKHDIDKIKKFEQVVDQIKLEDRDKKEKRALPSFEIDMSVGETESIFSEMLFNHVLETRLDELKHDGKPLFGISDEGIQHRVEELKADDLREFIGKSNESINENGQRDNNYWFRYVRGCVLATLIEKKYKENPSSTMNNFKTFLANGHTMSPEDVSRLFYTGSMQLVENDNLAYYDMAKEDFKQILAEKFSGYNIGPQVEPIRASALREKIAQKRTDSEQIKNNEQIKASTHDVSESFEELEGQKLQ